MDQLTMDCIAARKAGMSYGKWKALHGKSKGKVLAVVQPEEKVCAICGKEIIPRASGCGYQRVRYCSDACAYQAHKERMQRRYHEKKARGRWDDLISSIQRSVG